MGQVLASANRWRYIDTVGPMSYVPSEGERYWITAEKRPWCNDIHTVPRRMRRPGDTSSSELEAWFSAPSDCGAPRARRRGAEGRKRPAVANRKSKPDNVSGSRIPDDKREADRGKDIDDHWVFETRVHEQIVSQDGENKDNIAAMSESNTGHNTNTLQTTTDMLATLWATQTTPHGSG